MSTIPKESVAKFVVSDTMGNEQKVEATPTPSLVAEDDDVSSLNDDLRSVSGSNQLKSPSRMSVDSISLRRSFDSQSHFGGRISNRGFGFDHTRHSGSMDYSPIGNNSIYEIVMNTRRKNWLTYPSVADIPPITLTKNELPMGWKEKIDSYRKAINSEYSVFKATNNIKSVNRMQQIRQFSDSKLNPSDENEDGYEDNMDWNDQLHAAGVPEFYLDENFKLDNPRVFHKVLEGIELQLDNHSMSGTEERVAGYTILRQKLNEYLDVIENLLIKEISKSSHKYYRTLSEVDKLEESIKSCMETLDILSESLHKIDKEEIQVRLAKLKKICQRRNVEKLEQGLLQVKLVLDKVSECQKLYEEERLEDCLTLTSSINSLIHGDNTDKAVLEWTQKWPFKLVDLKTVPALSDSREFITNIEIEIGGKYSLKLCHILLDDINQYCQKLDEGLTIDYLKKTTGDKTQFVFDDSFRNDVTEVIRKLYRCEELTGAFDLYQEKTLTELKSFLKSYLPHESTNNSNGSGNNNESSENNNNERTNSNAASGSKLAHLIKEQSADEFVAMLEKIFLHESIALRRLYGHQKLLLDISLTEMNSISEPNENQHNMITQLDIRSGINEIIHIIQLRTGKIIAVRRELTSALKFNYFLKFYDTCVSFIQECEALTGEFLTKYLSDVLASQVKSYISQFGPRNTRKMQAKIVNEKWTPAIVKPSIQKSVNEMVSSNELDPLSWTKLSELFEETVETSTTDDGKPSGGHRKSVVVGDKTFVASESLLMNLTYLKELMILSLNLPSLYLPSLERQCYDFLRAFNSTAMNSVAPQGQIGKTTKNLSIMGESFDCLYEFVNIVQKFYQRLSQIFKDYRAFPDSYYNDLRAQYRSGSDKLYQAHAPPPPAP
ncbi:Vacuolar protein sorting-associated protein 54 [Nakaseomyces bracarensis]|uniref:Vacuolar protein sorting-associated protein 54 n=1 Tax=Nakaseomyces bracarensis TaxID=273131 RepID=A0ABR4NU52_9SACH